MTRTAADVLADRLIDWGVRVVFGLPGDGINGLMEALRTRQDRISFVQVRHEETAGFAATADVKYGGSALGCCVVTSGPGALHALSAHQQAALTGRSFFPHLISAPFRNGLHAAFAFAITACLIAAAASLMRGGRTAAQIEQAPIARAEAERAA